MENKCSNEKHVAVFCLSDMNDKKIKTRGYQCVCLECDKLVNIKENINEMNNVVFRKTELDPFMEYMNVIRNEYRNYVANGLTPEEAVIVINTSKTTEEEKPKEFKKTTNN